MRQIAKLYKTTIGAVLYRFAKYGIPTRTRRKIVLKYARRPFSRDKFEKAYLSGLRAGDIHARKRATNTVGVNVTTTYPAMIELFERTFGRYGHVKKYPAKGPLVYEWYVYCDLDTSFSFLIKKPTETPDGGDFYAFLAGYVDSEGTITFDCSGGCPRPHFWIKSQDVELLDEIRGRLKGDGFHASDLHLRAKSGTWTSRISRLNGATMSIQNTRDYYQLSLYRRDEIARLVKKLMQFSHHRGKIERMRLVLNAAEGHLTWDDVRNFIQNANRGKEECIKAAKAVYTQEHPGLSFPMKTLPFR